MENRDKETFSYTYSAKEQTEIQNIRKKYEMTTEQEDTLTQLRRLDAGVSAKATTAALKYIRPPLRGNRIIPNLVSLCHINLLSQIVVCEEVVVDI